MCDFGVLGALVLGGLIGTCIGFIIKWVLIKLHLIAPDEKE